MKGVTEVRRVVLVCALAALSVLAAPPSVSFAEDPARQSERCTVTGTDRGDRLVAKRRGDVLCGRGGNDVLVGRSADDVLLGGPGKDELVGAGGDDRLDGGSGADTLDGGTGLNDCVLSSKDTTERCVDAVSPTLVSFYRDPAEIDTTSDEATITYEVMAADDLAGVKSVHIDASQPGSSAEYGYHADLTSGSANAGTWTFPLEMPRYSPAGTHVVEGVEIVDRAGNHVEYSRADLEDLGFPTTTRQMSDEDEDLPSLLDFELTPQIVDTTQETQSIRWTVRASDELSGIHTLLLSYRRPSGTGEGGGGTLISGNRRNGVWEETIDLPRGSVRGVYPVSVSIEDRAGNYIEFDAEDLAYRELPSSFAQVGKLGDVAPPAISDVDVTPDAVDSSSADAEVWIEVQAADDLSGVDGSFYASVVGPTGAREGVRLAIQNNSSSNEGSWGGYFHVPRFSPHGDYVIEEIYADDKVGNRVSLDAVELAEAGFDWKFTNGPPLP